MSLNISTFSEAANSRILTGVITELDTDNNKAACLIGTATITGIPIYYYCNHGTLDHAVSKVFSTGDSVTLLYTGEGSAPSADNLTVVGMAEGLRACRVALGIVADLSGTTAAPGINSIGKYAFKSGAATLIPGSVLAGNNWWTDGALVISWSMPGSCRYAQDTNASTGDIYLEGSRIASFPGAIAGAAIRMEGGKKYVLVITGGTGLVWKKKAYTTGAWQLLSSGLVPTNKRPLTAVSFNADATRAVHCRDGYLHEYSISGDAFTVASSGGLITLQSHWSGYKYSWTAAADYVNNVLTIGTMEYYKNQVPDGVPTADEFGYYNRSGSELVGNDGLGDVYSFTADSPYADDITWTLTFGGIIIELYAQRIRRNRVTRYFHYGSTFDGNTAGNHPHQPISAFQTWKYTSETIEGLDVRAGFYATYKKETDTIIWTQSGTDPGSFNTATLARTKLLKGSIVRTGDPIGLAVTLNEDTFNITFLPIASGTKFDKPEIISGLPITNLLYPIPDGGNAGFPTVAIFNPYGQECMFVMHPAGVETMLCWLMEEAEWVLKYSEGDPAALTGKLPLRADSLVVC
jgi:hypothetical protein